MKTKPKKSSLKKKFSNYSKSMQAQLIASADITRDCCHNFLYEAGIWREYNQYLLETSDGNNED